MGSGTGSGADGTKEVEFTVSNLNSTALLLSLKGSALVAAAIEKTNSVEPISNAVFLAAVAKGLDGYCGGTKGYY